MLRAQDQVAQQVAGVLRIGLGVYSQLLPGQVEKVEQLLEAPEAGAS